MYRRISAVFMAAIMLVSALGSSSASANDREAFAQDARSKVAIVTGSNRGQGLGWVKHYLQNGVSVIATCRKPESATELKELAKQYGSQLLIEQLDVIDEESHAQLRKALQDNNISVDIAISNAGVTVQEEFGKWTKKGFEINIGVNTIGAALFAQTISPQLNDGAKLIQISSNGGCNTNQKRNNALDAYGISKAGLNHLSKRLSIKLADRKIIVVSMTPGSVLTDMNPAGKNSVTDAVNVMSQTIDKLTLEDSGKFMSNKGKTLPW